MSAVPLQQLSDFERTFPSFYVHPHVNLASNNRFIQGEMALSSLRNQMDESLFGSSIKQEEGQPAERELKVHSALSFRPRKKQRCLPPPTSVKSIIAQLDGAAQNPIDLTGSGEPQTDPLETLKDIPVKVIKFYQDVRPPYKGTYTKITSSTQAKKFARKPFARSRPDTDYDYDSEAEWEDPGEGEDLMSEDDDEPEDDDDEDMQGFLDNEDAEERRRPLLGNMEPSCTGICWADADSGPDLSQFRIDMLTGKLHALQCHGVFR